MNKYKPDELDKFFQQVKELVADAQYKLRAIDLRQFIDQIYPREGVISKKDFDEMNRRFVGLNERIGKIEECLGIDFKLDGNKQERIAELPIEYHFIKNDIIRDKITAYYREMLRYLYATRNHKQCFGEFCRLAIIQVELMLNYFFTDDSKFETIKERLQKQARNDYERAFNTWRNCGRGRQPNIKDYENKMLDNKEESVSRLNYSTKSEVFCRKYNLEKKFIGSNTITSISIWTANMRNRKSHGSWTSIEPYEDDYQVEIGKTNLEKLEKDLLEKVEQYNKTHEKGFKYENKRLTAAEKDKEVWNDAQDIKLLNDKFTEIQWVSKKPFNEVYEFLRIIASICAKELGEKE